MHKTPDSDLLKELKSGNQKAFDILFVKYYKLLVANAYFYVKDEQEAKDIVQEFLSDLWEKKLYTKLEGDIKSYLYRAVQNRCINFHRKQTVEQRRYALIAQDVQYQPAESLHSDEDLERLKEAIDELSPQRKEALQRVFLEEKKYQVAADEMGVSLNTLKTHLKIGIRNLREKLTHF